MSARSAEWITKAAHAVGAIEVRGQSIGHICMKGVPDSPATTFSKLRLMRWQHIDRLANGRRGLVCPAREDGLRFSLDPKNRPRTPGKRYPCRRATS